MAHGVDVSFNRHSKRLHRTIEAIIVVPNDFAGLGIKY
jgi:hypothetical protein